MTRINAKSLKRDTKCQQTQGLNNHEIQHEDMKLIQRDTKRKKQNKTTKTPIDY